MCNQEVTDGEIILDVPKDFLTNDFALKIATPTSKKEEQEVMHDQSHEDASEANTEKQQAAVKCQVIIDTNSKVNFNGKSATIMQEANNPALLNLLSLIIK